MDIIAYPFFPVQVKEAHGQCAILEAKERESATELKVVKSELTSAVAREQEQVLALAACRRDLEACKSELEACKTQLQELEACKTQLQASEEARKVDQTDLEKLKGVAGGGREGEELSGVKRELEATRILRSRLYSDFTLHSKIIEHRVLRICGSC